MYNFDRPLTQGSILYWRYQKFKQFYDDPESKYKLKRRFLRGKFEYLYYNLTERKGESNLLVAFDATIRWTLFYSLFRLSTLSHTFGYFRHRIELFDWNKIYAISGRSTMNFASTLFTFVLMYRILDQYHPNQFTNFAGAGLFAGLPWLIYDLNPQYCLVRCIAFAVGACMYGAEYLPNHGRDTLSQKIVTNKKRYPPPVITDY